MDVIVLGAGAVGTSAALMLARRGLSVTLIDAKTPASETSFGNAGIVSDSSCVPFNNPGLARQLPRLLLRRNAALHWNFSYLAANLPWCIQFLSHAGHTRTECRARRLHQFINRGKTLHLEWLSSCGMERHLRAAGWMKVYRSRNSFAAAAPERAFWKMLGVAYRELGGEEVVVRAQALHPIFAAGVLLQESLALVNPQAVVVAYADWFVTEGGRLLRQTAESLAPTKKGWQVCLRNGEKIAAKRVVVALGPWTKNFLSPLGVRLPMGYERGGHRHFCLDGAVPALPVADMDGGYNAVMQEYSLRMTSGVYLADIAASPPRRQLDMAEANLRAAVMNVGNVVGDDWFGARPTMPDSLPLIGETKRKGLWLVTGNQHIGLMSSPASGELIAQLINGESPTLAHDDFSPRRFNL